MGWLPGDRSRLGALVLAALALSVAPVAAQPASKLRDVSRRVEGVVRVSETECTFEIESSSAGLRSQVHIPLRKVAWAVEKRHDGQLFAKATCRTSDDCVKGRMEGRTIDVPHQFFWQDTTRSEWSLSLGTTPAREVGHVLAALRDASRFCKKTKP
jgi:hypothetical protein